MRLLVVNPNTSETVTGVVARAAPRFASPGTEFTFVTGSFGARVVVTRSEEAVAAHGTVDLIGRNAAGHDAIVLAISFDSGLRAARELTGLPVLGMTEAALLSATTLGRRIGLVILAGRSRPLYEDLVESYGLGRLVCGIRSLDNDSLYGDSTATGGGAELAAAARDLVRSERADVVVLVGAVLAGRSVEVERAAGVPVLDGIRAAVPLAEALVRMRQGASAD